MRQTHSYCTKCKVMRELADRQEISEGLIKDVFVGCEHTEIWREDD